MPRETFLWVEVIHLYEAFVVLWFAELILVTIHGLQEPQDVERAGASDGDARVAASLKDHSCMRPKD